MLYVEFVFLCVLSMAASKVVRVEDTLVPFDEIQDNSDLVKVADEDNGNTNTNNDKLSLCVKSPNKTPSKHYSVVRQPVSFFIYCITLWF